MFASSNMSTWSQARQQKSYCGQRPLAMPAMASHTAVPVDIPCSTLHRPRNLLTSLRILACSSPVRIHRNPHQLHQLHHLCRLPPTLRIS